MSDFRPITPRFWAAPQISVADVGEAASQGVSLIINNRPASEAPADASGAAIARAAQEAGIAYCAIPVEPGGFDEGQVASMVDALERGSGTVLAYCRSGTRSTLLWALAQARMGREVSVIAEEAAGGGYDVSPIRGVLQALSEQSRK